ncbi:pentatricopeptide repeat-containing protein At2g29760, chloroplastic-like [Amborella trichopoda]|uniref:pentatricopeptide repeat-containing protein At2g29760, chloroplastic-like n=1 Tax=Amborella trichopoda TaxID=13333 RepID=UPI0005D3AE63|nr:pentatricopeptide repeat-containing protein At2g29760, chloroplastic-like [Amborella trichopoda]|eukprot:XP_011624645.1 pentatricopeptide repeat-containing protein At2g29760, chloroplastic-like [Amborella trichopoda]
MLKSYIKVSMEIHSQAIKLGLDQDAFVMNSMLHAYASCGGMEFAHEMFNEMAHRDVVSWTAVIAGYARNGRSREALELFFLMGGKDFMPDEITMVTVINACSRLKDLQMGREIERMVHEMGVGSNVYIMNSLIDMYAKCGCMDISCELFNKMGEKNLVSWNSMVAGYVNFGDMKSAREIFDKMPERNVVSWSAMVSGYSQNGEFKEALTMYSRMKASAVPPNNASITSAISACSNLGVLELGQKIHKEIKESKIKRDVLLSTALVDMYAKCGELEKAQLLFDGIQKKSLISWNVMIMGLAIHGRVKDCLETFAKMERDGFKPDSVTFVGVLSGCAHAGWLEGGRDYFHRMSEIYGISPKLEHYACMVDLLGRAGLIEEAYEFVKTSVVKPDVVIWGSLLSACKVHGNVGIGELVASHLLELDPGHGGAHVLLSNIYAASSRWGEVMEVRKRMRERGIESRRGWSLIELGATVHEFLVRDDMHPQIGEILFTLRGMEPHMKSID